MKSKKAKNYDEAWAIQEKYTEFPNGWIQWKGTSVCMDVRCKCGVTGHIDADFAYSIKCSACGTIYFCNGHIELIEIEESTGSCVVETQTDDEESYA
jgi:hypothetical protein